MHYVEVCLSDLATMSRGYQFDHLNITFECRLRHFPHLHHILCYHICVLRYHKLLTQLTILCGQHHVICILVDHTHLVF